MFVSRRKFELLEARVSHLASTVEFLLLNRHAPQSTAPLNEDLERKLLHVVDVARREGMIDPPIREPMQ